MKVFGPIKQCIPASIHVPSLELSVRAVGHISHMMSPGCNAVSDLPARLHSFWAYSRIFRLNSVMVHPCFHSPQT